MTVDPRLISIIEAADLEDPDDVAIRWLLVTALYNRVTNFEELLKGRIQGVRTRRQGSRISSSKGF